MFEPIWVEAEVEVTFPALTFYLNFTPTTYSDTCQLPRVEHWLH